MQEVVFTICAKNYLAQALSLRESFLRYNQHPFYIFLSDLPDHEDLTNIPNLIELNDNWLPNWDKMAFKYNVIEFSTSIKPYCINELFNRGFNKVIYLDPDIFVYDNLDFIFQKLDEKSIILTPHRCRINKTNEELIREQLLSSVGIYNLGFFAVKKDTIGKNVVNWWKEKLTDKCLNDFSQGLFVDQKWMDYVPGFYPKDVLISSHLGLNVATWNLQERDVIEKDGSYFIIDKFGNEIFKLIFFHYSGYNPNIPELLDKRIKRSDMKNHPVLQKLANEYRLCEMNNNYCIYSKMKYSFNNFTNGQKILDLHRKLYYYKLNKNEEMGNPFDSNSFFYTLLAKRNLLENNVIPKGISIAKMKTKGPSQKFFKYYVKTKGINAYLNLINKLKYYTKIEYIKYMID